MLIIIKNIQSTIKLDNIYSFMSSFTLNGIILSTLLICSILCAPSTDRMTKIPGYPDSFMNTSSIYSGYLDLQNVNRSAHYVFVQSKNGPNNDDPLTLWLNGGPGCSSLLGFIQQIGPYYLEDGVNYKLGDNLTKNQYSWHQVSNLLFLQSPAGVGFSYNLDKKFQYTDYITAIDNLNALLSFYDKFPEYKNKGLWIAGQSYAGKYIPDLAQLILQSNDYNGTKIKLKGILIGNGVMSFDHLHQSQVEFMLARSFIDPQTIQYWKSSCQTDPHSAGCRFFQIRYQQDTDELNPYNVYGYCYYNDSFDMNKTKRYESQGSILQKLKKQFNKKVVEMGSVQKVDKLTYSSQVEDLVNLENNLHSDNTEQVKSRYNGAPCAYFDGMFNYFNLHAKQYNAKFTDMRWNGPCAQNITYHIDPRGSIQSYKYLLARQKNRTQIHLYNGNWDVVVPYVDSVKNIVNKLKLRESRPYDTWIVNKQHVGFYQLYSGLIFTTVKGASHQVPQSKRLESLQLFNDTISGNPEIVEI